MEYLSKTQYLKCFAEIEKQNLVSVLKKEQIKTTPAV